jgi:hypothetical protein
MTYCATTASKERIRERQILGVHHRERLDIGKPSARTRLCALRSIGSEISTPHKFRGARIIRQRQSGADADIENPPADPVGFRDGRLAAVVENLAEYQIVDRRPAPISLCDPRAVDI